MYRPHKHVLGGFAPCDGSIDFYLRVNTLSDPKGTYLDYGAGRASWYEEESNAVKTRLRHMQGKFAEVVAADIDPVVLDNRSVDQALIIEDDRVALPDASVDVIVADFVIEHVQAPQKFATEIARLLKPGGWFCARTPHKFHYVALAERLMTSGMENRLIRWSQPDRNEKDVFQKTYKMNTMRDITAAFPGWKNQSLCRRSDPAYYFGRRSIFLLADFLHRLMPVHFSGNIFIFLQKPTVEK